MMYFVRLVLLLHCVALGKLEVIQTIMKKACGDGNAKNPGLSGERSVIPCAVHCAMDNACSAYSHPPCVLHSAQQSLTCPSDHAANHTFIKKVRTGVVYYC